MTILRPGLPIIPDLSTVTFTARCPRCSNDAGWHQSRRDTTTTTQITCDCEVTK